LKLKIDQEIDRLSGEFRKKEYLLIKPLLNKYTRLELQMEELQQ